MKGIPMIFVISAIAAIVAIAIATVPVLIGIHLHQRHEVPRASDTPPSREDVLRAALRPRRLSRRAEVNLDAEFLEYLKQKVS